MNAPIVPDGEESLRSKAMNILGYTQNCNIYQGCYLKGYYILCNDEHVPVRMSPGSAMFHPGYRTDGHTPRNLFFHKGCRPLGVRKDSQGREWFLMEASMDWSDDHTVIFSSLSEGDATLEMCDWIKESDVRVIFRCDI